MGPHHAHVRLRARAQSVRARVSPRQGSEHDVRERATDDFDIARLVRRVHAVGTNLFIATDTVIWRYDLTQTPPTGNALAGEENQRGATDGTGNFARFSNPSGLAVDASGNLWISEVDDYRVRYIENATTATLNTGVNVTTIAGDTLRGVKLGPLPTRLDQVRAMTMFNGEPHFISENSILRLR